MATIRDLVSAIRQRAGIAAAVVLGRDGLLIDHQADGGVDAEEIAARVPSILQYADELGAAVVPVDVIMSLEADVFSPCALGAVLTKQSIAALRVAAVAGGANNQLATEAQGAELAAHDILYAPDYVINAGGIINVLRHLGQGGDAEVNARIDGIPGRLEAIWRESAATGDTPAHVADRMAQKLIGRV